MPIYEYHCSSCGEDFEKLIKAGDVDAAACPACGSSDTVRKISAFSGAVKSGDPCSGGGG